MKNIRLIDIFVASPSDVIEEREMIRTVIRDYNSMIGISHGIQCRFIGWEDSTYSAMGTDGQAVINNQIGEEYDVFFCILWTKLGTPTKRSTSGTAEEYERALARFKEYNDIHISFYIKTDPVPPNDLDASQLKLTQEFIKKVRNDGCLTKDVSTADFEKTILRDLTSIVADFLTKNNGQITPESNGEEELIPDYEPSDENPEDLLLLDHREILDDSMAKINQGSNQVTETLMHLTAKLGQATKELQELLNKGNVQPKETKRIINGVANELNQYSSIVESVLPMFKKNISQVSTSITGIQMILLDEPALDEGNFEENANAADELVQAMLSAKFGLSSFHDSFDSLPDLTGAMRKARKRALRNTNSLSTALGSGAVELMQVSNRLSQ